MANEKVKRIFFIIKAVIIAGVSITLVVLFILSQGFPLDVKEYQRIYANCDNTTGIHTTEVIDSRQDELTIEKKFGISIRDGTDYEQYSLVLSQNFEITKYTMFPLEHPNAYTRGDDISICEPEKGKRYVDIYIVYCVKQKNIISSDEILFE